MPTAILDACVLYPLPLRDTLLRVAEAGVYDARWSDRILDEMERNLVADGRATAEIAGRLRAAMTRAFGAAAVPQAEVDGLEESMTNDPKDRHVLAAAVVGRADVVVTLNLRDFPLDACRAVGVEPMHPDDFLLDAYDEAPAPVFAAVERQAADLKRPPSTLDQLLDRLEVSTPRFAETMRRHRDADRARPDRPAAVEAAPAAGRRTPSPATARDRGVSR